MNAGAGYLGASPVVWRDPSHVLPDAGLTVLCVMLYEGRPHLYMAALEDGQWTIPDEMRSAPTPLAWALVDPPPAQLLEGVG